MGNVKIAALISGAALTLGVLASCATLDESQCRAVDWTALGYEDGAAGRTPSHIERHREACQRFRLPVEEQSWRGGWEEGIRLYCTPANGLNEGRHGRSYANSCPIELKAEFEDAYRVAKRLHDAEARLSRERNQIESLVRDEAKAETQTEVSRIRQQISSRRLDLFRAEMEVRDADREYDRYMLRLRS